MVEGGSMKIHIRDLIVESDEIVAIEAKGHDPEPYDVGDPEYWLCIVLRNGKELTITATDDDDLKGLWNSFVSLMNVHDLNKLIERIRLLEHIGCPDAQ